MQQTYQTLAAPAEAEFKDKGSRFIAFAHPVQNTDEIKRQVETLREAHHKARHWCYAWRLGTDGNRFRANDDGEPAGSAGRPILGQIDSAGLTDVLVVVVRYFGGTLLGVPGLIHAYKTATAQALASAEVVVKPVLRLVALRCDYAHLSEALRIAKQHAGQVVVQDLQWDCQLQIALPLAQAQACMDAWRQTRHIVLIGEDAPA